MKFTDFAPFIRPEVQGCPDFLLERAVRDAATDFCRRTDVYLAEPEYIQISAGVNEYTVTIPSGTELNHIVDIYNDNIALNPVSFTELLKRLGDENTRGNPKFYAQRDNKDFYLAPIPAEKDTLRVLYSLKPTSSSTSIPDTIGKEYREIISHGALFRLQMMAGQPFSNPNFGAINRDLFEKEVGRTIRQSKYGFSGGSLTCKPRGFI
ncbi:MAG: hypothetical protein KJO69_06985 [Gammaproteobacteria bacterium]|nr:hypothetical protein [Gammaproteobacteria bacterium]